jgi:hypothetical protein
VIVVYPALRPEPALVVPGDATVRGATIQALAPAGAVALPVEFRWSSPIAPARYEVTVFAASREALWTWSVTDQRAAAPPELLEKLRAGDELTWQVTAIGERGERLIQSAPQRFVVSRRAP